jgi:dephospho-CoA kinase
LIFSEVPLLFEAGFDKDFSKIICILCSETTRLKRAKERGIKNLTIFEKIKNIQLPQEYKKKKADYILDSEKEIKPQLLKIIKKLNL